MGMPIEQKIKTLMEMHHYIRGDVHFCGYNEEDVTNALETAIDTMRKYQKIQEIVKDWEDGHFSDAVGCLRVKAVVEDGNDKV